MEGMPQFEQSQERLVGDLVVIAEAHRLSAGERDKLRRSIVGAISGNRDRPVFLLARAVLEAKSDDLFNLILPDETPLQRSDAAFLDFLLTAATADKDDFDRIVNAFDTASLTRDPVRHLCSSFASVLHAYRREVLPETRHHNVFSAIRRYYAQYRPEDPHPRNGDAVDFWSSIATRDLLTRYTTALNGLSDYAEAARLAESWRHPVALDDERTLDLPSESADDALSDDPMSSPTLKADINIISECAIKLLLANECKTLTPIAEHADVVARWPYDTLAALAVGPVQNSITEALRRQERTLDIDQQMQKVPKYEQIIQQHRQLAERIDDCLYLIHLSGCAHNEMAAARSNVTIDRLKRIDAMTRRKGYAGFDAGTRMNILKQKIEPLLHLKAMLARYVKAWDGFENERLMSLEVEHSLLFTEKMGTLYPSCDAGVAP